MPALLDSDLSRSRSGKCVTIGLINNMADEALKATERQYISLLNSASEGMLIHLSLYTLPGVPRNESSDLHIRSHYSSIEDLWNGHVDGIIVTGREPRASDLMDEPYWESFTQTLAWAQENAYSSVWSCLAAHAAILHMDGIDRANRSDKLCGIFECARVSDHPLTAGTPSLLKLPHSRWNGVPEAELFSCGYSLLTRSAEAGVDTFIKQQKRLFVFFQGHPEYESDTLLREYRRDIGRYFTGETHRYPSIPQSYFDCDTSNALVAIQERAISGQGVKLLLEVSAVLGSRSIENTWQPTATGIYGNWLRYIRAQKEKALRSNRVKPVANPPRVRWVQGQLETSCKLRQASDG